ncbi:ABC transporter permease subunit [Bacillus sp. KH172YL63]|uniref:ABC transporter permease subunit n=1 Tax=Bacillus sp. KH172YL63 TaxID=2709784 RepID=UPI0013E5068A|nr:ABC transporter permease subunit [Bacillus sp. KH172YL63]BCB02887.1 peptide ABC transporter permease [Bacillus sp. KH172YL63]
MLNGLWRRPRFLAGFLFITGVLLLSFMYEPFIEEHVKMYSFFDHNGERVGPPFTPAELPPFGSDRLGIPLWTYVIQGAKYTILIGLSISLLQMVLAFSLSVLFIKFFNKLQSLLEGLVEAMMYIPMAVIAYLLLSPISFVIEEPEKAFVKVLCIQIFILTIVGIPPLIVVLSKEIRKVLQEEFILSARTLGARGISLYKKHVLTALFPRLILLFFQRNVAVLILFAHLGFLEIFLGGAVEREIMIDVIRKFSLSNEWAGNIGKSYFELMVAPWILFVPLVALSLTAFSYNLMASSLQKILLGDKSRVKKSKKKDVDGGNRDKNVMEGMFVREKKEYFKG